MNTPNFDKVASFYDFLAGLIFGNAIKRSQTVFLNQIPHGAKVLIVGGGTGWIVGEILEQAVPSKVVFVEASQNMLRLAQRKNKGVKNVEWVLGTQQDVSSTEQFDIIFTAYFLDVFSDNELPEVVQKLSKHLKKEGRWIFADFVKQNWLVKVAYFFFRITTGLKNQQLPDYDKALQGFSVTHRKAFYGKMIEARIYRFQ